MEKIFIGWDARENEAFEVCQYSLNRRSAEPLDIMALRIQAVRHQGLFWRRQKTEGNKRVDLEDGKPFSTDFAFTRFLVPTLMNYEGWALFCDCDFLFLRDVGDLFHLRDDRYAVMCVKHEYAPTGS